ncbi:hypothetical protein, partial [Mesomycoplasma ovipneumoniae]|uniref:hypothetical protein n=1 Tax=Mesomycoplasma ovipneumoniae TaxID=29562 RepID=UPI0031191C26
AKSLKNEMRIITSKKKSDRTTEEITKLDQLRYDVKLKQEERDRELFDELNNYAEIVNSANFVFPISHFKINDTQFFNIESSRWEHFYAIKNLQRTLKKLYGVKMSSRH